VPRTRHQDLSTRQGDTHIATALNSHAPDAQSAIPALIRVRTATWQYVASRLC
jgi:hypothetical protein